MGSQRIAVITGSNRGIGHAVCAILAQTASTPLIIYAASRAGTPLQLRGSIRPVVEIRPAKLSLTDNASIIALRDQILQEHGGCDVLINNAGVYYFRENLTPAERKETIRVNYYGTLKMCQEFIPIMRSKGRIVNVSSQSGQLKYFHPDIRKKFLNPDLTLEGLSALVSQYEDAAQKHKEVAFGWPPMTYFTSKAAVNAATRILAHGNPQILINCCCPGWVDTSLGSQAGPPPKTAEEGAKIPLQLGFGNIGFVSGRYWANDAVYQTSEGKVQDW